MAQSSPASKIKYQRSPKGKSASRAYYQRTKLQRSAQERERRYQQQFGITVAEYEALLESQKHRCAACGRRATEFARRLAVDHCHITGKVRGLLCFHCNSTLGKFGDDPIPFEMIAAYLRRTSCHLDMKN